MEPPPKQTSYKLNLALTQQLSKTPKYVEYKQWLKQNGVLIDHRLIYPAYFGHAQDGVVGVAVSEDIPAKCAVVAVPYKLMIYCQKILCDPEIVRIFQENTHLFEDMPDQMNTFKLFIYLCKQMLKGQRSFYAPYFNICDGTYLQKWTKSRIKNLQNQQVQNSIQKSIHKFYNFGEQFVNLFNKYKHEFNFKNKNIQIDQYRYVFNKGINILNSRSFGSPFPNSYAIPMADSLNHNNYDYVTHMFVDLKQQVSRKQRNKNKFLQDVGVNQKCQYRSKYNKYDLSILQKVCQSISDSKSTKKSVKDRRTKFIQKYQQKYIHDPTQVHDKYYYILWQQYKNKDTYGKHKKLIQLYLFQQSCEQDQNINEQQYEIFVSKEDSFILQQQSKNYQVINESNKVQRLIKYWTIFLDYSFKIDNKPNNKQLIGQQIDVKSQNLSNHKNNKQNIVFQKNQNQQQMLNQDYSSSLSQSLSSNNISQSDYEQSEDEQEYQWLFDKHKSQKLDKDKVYFIMTTCNSITKHNQIYNFYGRRSNKFLLSQYNFVLQNNKYDSFAFRLYIDDWTSHNTNIFQTRLSPQLMICRNVSKNSKLYTKNIKIRKNKVCIDLVNHCRALMIGWTNISDISKDKRVRITVPFCKNFQLQTLQLCNQFIACLRTSFKTSLQSDKQQLSKTQLHEERLSFKLKINYKQILIEQQQMINMCIECLQKWQNGRIQIGNQFQMKRIIKIKDYLRSLQTGEI